MKRFLFIILVLCLYPQFAISASSPSCVGKFANPITDICWSCAFPMTIGKHQVMTMDQEDIPSITSGGAIPTCRCNLEIGLKIGFWEPSRMVDVTRTPYCFVGLGGITIDFGFAAPAHTQTQQVVSGQSYSFYQMHWYTNPLMFWLEVLLDHKCLEKGVLDVAYITEIDPLWGDSETTFILNPDVTLFSNVIAQAACAVDCVAATAGFPRNELFWCAGCQGSMFPLTGWVGSKIGGVQASSLLVARMTNKMHRELLMWGASGEEGLCGYYPEPLMDKTKYKYSMVYPIPQTQKIAGKCCQPFGRSSVLWGSGKEYPIQGEDFVYQIYRKRDCCAGDITEVFKGE